MPDGSSSSNVIPFGPLGPVRLNPPLTAGVSSTG